MDRSYQPAYRRVFLGSLNMNMRKRNLLQFFQLSWNIHKLIQRNLDLLKHRVILGEVTKFNVENDNDDIHFETFSPKR